LPGSPGGWSHHPCGYEGSRGSPKVDVDLRTLGHHGTGPGRYHNTERTFSLTHVSILLSSGRTVTGYGHTLGWSGSGCSWTGTRCLHGARPGNHHITKRTFFLTQQPPKCRRTRWAITRYGHASSLIHCVLNNIHKTCLTRVYQVQDDNQQTDNHKVQVFHHTLYF